MRLYLDDGSKKKRRIRIRMIAKEGAVEKRLWKQARNAIHTLQGLRSPKVNDIFDQRFYIAPTDLVVKNYLRPTPIAAFNPGAVLKNGRLLIFPRLVFDYFTYTSSIGVFDIPIDKALRGQIPKPLSTRIILWPKEPWEFGPGCEDPRVAMWNREIYILYTGARQYNEDHKVPIKPVQGIARFSSSLELRSRNYFSIHGKGKDEVFTPSAKDSALLAPKNEKAVLLWRPRIGDLSLCWRGEADLGEYSIAEESMDPVLVPERWESRVGWSTNALPMGKDEYLVGWHGVSRDDQAYRDGLALVDGEGYVRAISDYLLVPQGLNECYGDRPQTMFGNGLIQYQDKLIWVGGIGDYAIGIFTAPIERALERLRKI
jgi:predicted GH43/DUF377 family glycosyl hydrolase